MGRTFLERIWLNGVVGLLSLTEATCWTGHLNMPSFIFYAPASGSRTQDYTGRRTPPGTLDADVQVAKP